MPDLADVISISCVNGTYSFSIDGIEFPWLVASTPGPVVSALELGEMPTLTVSLLANRVEFVHDLDSPEIRAEHGPTPALVTKRG